MNNISYLKEKFDEIQSKDSGLSGIRQKAFDAYAKLGIPTVRNEEWKYTRVSGIFNQDYKLAEIHPVSVEVEDFETFRLPGCENANQLVFINGVYSTGLSTILSPSLSVMGLEEAAAGEFSSIVAENFNHSARFLKDGINALNTAFIHGAVFIAVKKNKAVEHPVYIYNITDARNEPVLSQPRSLVYVAENAQVEMVETYNTIGHSDSIVNQVMEIVVEKDAFVYYYKIQQDSSQASQVSTTHIRQVGKSFAQAVTISLSGNIVRNNLHAILEAPFAEAHMYGLYLQKGNSHVDNHTLVDHAVPNCESNELYKGILDDNSTGVFNGKVMVRKDAQKTNAFQSNKNILLSDNASVNTKPQLEIYADDVKCSHGCTIGSLDPEGLFYLQSRGIPRKAAMALLLQGFAVDVTSQIKPAAIRAYVEDMIIERLSTEA
ncbi:MAG: Fe-S cluster assembly protein SufD [Chitinophagaceae bacterium]|nr:MAG: Fe-S cluster assembly protein SufD [Chitinophagaceae bacterium]